MKSLATLKLTSASRNARRTSRKPSFTFSAVSRPRPRSFLNASPSERVMPSNMRHHREPGNVRAATPQQDYFKTMPSPVQPDRARAESRRLSRRRMNHKDTKGTKKTEEKPALEKHSVPVFLFFVPFVTLW